MNWSHLRRWDQFKPRSTNFPACRKQAAGTGISGLQWVEVLAHEENVRVYL
ncbi:MAG: hypothetical protein ACE144_04140 [Thermodesulfobacteriota bacterium]